MSTKVLIGVSLFAFACSGCNQPDNSVAVPPGEAAKANTKPAPQQTASGKPAFSKIETD